MKYFLKSVLFFFFAISALAKPIEIPLWHSLSGYLGEEINQLAGDFNRSQKDYLIKPIYKGEYNETLTGFAAAFRAKQPPALVQIFEVGTSTMLHPPGIIKPVDKLMEEEGLSLPKESFLPAIRAFYSEGDTLQAMPFNVSIPVIYYNADVLEELGYQEGTFPQTWDEMEVLASKLRNKGFACAYTSAYPAWIQIESFRAIHGLSLFVNDVMRVNYNKAILRHLQRLKKWQQQHYFEYGGRDSNATVLFTSGRCPLFSQSSGSYASLLTMVNFRLGAALMPLDPAVSIKRHNNVIGGAALWVTAGQSKEIYRGIAHFFSYLVQPQVQKKWYLHTGYLPLGTDGIYPEKKYYPILALAKTDLTNSVSSGLIVNLPNQIRMIDDEALEAIFADIKTPKQALDEAVKRANYALMRFTHNTATKLVKNDAVLAQT